jgi:hypothetical protein
MRKRIVLFAAAAVAAIAPTQAAAHHTPAHTQAQLSQTRAQLRALRTFVHDCLAWRVVPIAQYGNPPNEGFVYDFGDSTEPSTALDLADPPEQFTFLVAAVMPTAKCIRQVGPRASAAARTTRSSALARKAQRLG